MPYDMQWFALKLASIAVWKYLLAWLVLVVITSILNFIGKGDKDNEL